MQQDRKSPRQTEDQVNTVVDCGHIGDDMMTHIDPAQLIACNEAREENIANFEGTSRSKKWWTSVFAVGKKYRSISLQNKGSVARDHLALGMTTLSIFMLGICVERTFLAWLRTSLAFTSIGVAVTQLFRLNNVRSTTPATDYYESILISSDATQQIRRLGKPLGTTFIGMGVATLLLGSNRYFECQKWIIRGKFPACRGSITLMVVMAFALMVTSLFVIMLDPGK
ncbi:putative pf02656 domain protein [Erysiphe neolycopersici]|uniref:Putative pf02656 domain protein n=1 Tax=Erysiphe neolycopersici TaxID=212602 RepID=A0A420HXI6_9PEZI|nr:putative pf02656 domain protein [Erysiphe neolycopersici]